MIVDCAVYTRGVRTPGELTLEAAYEASRAPDSFVWIGLHEPSENEFNSVTREFGLHELAVEDAIKAHQRPKLEEYGESLFIVLKTARYLDQGELVAFGEILLFIGEGFIVSVRHGETALHDVRLRLESRPDLLEHGTGAVLYAIVDRVVDDYLPVIEELEGDIQEVESQVFSDARENAAERIYRLKRTVLALRDAVVPLVEPLSSLSAGQHALVREDTSAYFRDVYDHLRRAVDRVENSRDLLTSVLTANLTQVSVRQNEDVRKISAWAAIIAVPTAIAGIYGMNFEHMPELGWRFGFPLVILVVLIVCLILYRAFRRAGWL